LAACAAGSESLPNGTGSDSITLKLTLPDGVRLDSAGYTITGPGAYHKSARIKVAASGATFDATISGIPAATGYSILLDAIESDGVTTCSGSATFTVSGAGLTVVALDLRCLGQVAQRADAGSMPLDAAQAGAVD